ncbi:MAG: glycogen synthase GlgA [Planctomycetota bacterium]|nr:glycogen synthase GlgA [Planctomycetota bacterium]
MNILFASSEIVPFAKTGGLADVSNALPRAMADMGHQMHLFLPAYRSALDGGASFEEAGFKDAGILLQIPVGTRLFTGRVLTGKLPESTVPVYLITQDEFFDREGIYGENGEDYDDNCARFVFFCRSILETARLLRISYDLVHCNDWQTGLLPAIVKLEQRPVSIQYDVPTVMTIHNLAYQGNFHHLEMKLTGIDWKHFNWEEMEFHGNLSLLKTGIVYADAISTVSPTYAREIQTVEHGCGLDEVLRHRASDLTGIINGVDDSEWNPANDRHLATNFDVSNWKTGKGVCKTELQQIMGLPTNPDVPVVGIIGRLAEQKGWDLIIEVMRSSLSHERVQWVILGTGEARFEKEISLMAREWPEKVGAQLTFSNELAHKIEAGADLFLMPSRYEPCGLNQLYSLKYGTVPVTRETGGLKDTVINADESAVANQRGNGFTFTEYSVEALQSALGRALITYSDHPEIWGRIVETGMQQDWSWAESARKYDQLYESLTTKRQIQRKPHLQPHSHEAFD